MHISGTDGPKMARILIHPVTMIEWPIQPGKGTLIFARPLEHDEGIYQCFAYNEAGVASTVKVELRQASEC